MSRLRIGFMTNEVIGSYQRLLFQAMVEQAQIAGVDLISYEGRCIDSPLFRDNQYNLIFDFIDHHSLDGLVISSASVFSFIDSFEVNRWLDQRFELPLVSIGWPLRMASNILLDEQAGFTKLIEHLIEQHHCRHFVFVGGVEQNQEAQDRKMVFGQVMANHQIDHQTIWLTGDFTAQSGVEAMAEVAAMIAQGQRIDAVSFANDEMAIAAIDYLNRMHPELVNQLVISGFDDCHYASMIAPSLTTVRQPFEDIAGQAIGDLIERISQSGKKQSGKNQRGKLQTYHFGTEPIFRRSCGCIPQHSERQAQLHRFAGSNYKMHEMTQSYDVDELFAQLATGLPHFDVVSCYVALYEGGRFHHTDSGHERIPLQSRLVFAYHQHQHCPLQSAIVFNTRDILPASFLAVDQPLPLLVKPLMFDNQHFGFIVFDVSEGWLEDMEDIRRQVARTLNAALLFEEKSKAVREVELANARLLQLNTELEKVNELLSKRSVTDELTGLYNRRGFFELVRQYAVTDRTLKRCTLFYADMNDLKMVNDKLGHHQGDYAIQLVAKALQLTFRNEDIIGRIGGDEFVVCAKRCGPNDIESLVQRFEQSLAQCNEQSSLPWDVSSCMGYQVFNGGSEQELEHALEQADRMLYRNKAAYKRRKGQPNEPN
ncbi:diguanylate cyclase [Neiella sp. HB171785]|uniref:Diguanylate cyclase n=1 Tax=Neiella litorisoli TaxID=2771431 RepID=A0A8J6QFA2_9GAMM|nr:diguanylate cyclase [Neiella litorisoli]MBD1388220.1 diguanylate cyclase [Neiella litorisoli]